MPKPNYFYSLDAITDEGRARWYDDFAVGGTQIVIPGKTDNPRWLRQKKLRELIYNKWQDLFGIPRRQNLFQAIRVLDKSWEHEDTKMWFPDYRDCVFRVFVNPHTVYDEYTREHVQFYVLSPEDSYLVNRYELLQNSPALRPRDYNKKEKFMSSDPRLRRMRVIPTKACHHLRHETTGGVLPGNL